MSFLEVFHPGHTVEPKNYYHTQYFKLWHTDLTFAPIQRYYAQSGPPQLGVVLVFYISMRVIRLMMFGCSDLIKYKWLNIIKIVIVLYFKCFVGH